MIVIVPESESVVQGAMICSISWSKHGNRCNGNGGGMEKLGSE